MWSFLAGLPALLGKVLDLLRAWGERRERQELKAEATDAATVAVDHAELTQERETRDAMDQAVSAVPDRDAASQRLRDGSF